MKTLLTVLWLGYGLIEASAAFGSLVTSLSQDTIIRSRFESLTHRLRLEKPLLVEGEYEVRMWVKEQLRFGDFHELYVVTKAEKRLTVTKYSLNYNDKHVFKGFKKQTAKQDFSFWEKLMANDITTLPDMKSLPVFKPYKPEPIDTSRRVDVSKEGEVTITMKKQPVRRFVLIADGVSYHFEIFSKNGYHQYNYHCPSGYGNYYADTMELKKASTIIDRILRLFNDSNLLC